MHWGSAASWPASAPDFTGAGESQAWLAGLFHLETLTPCIHHQRPGDGTLWCLPCTLRWGANSILHLSLLSGSCRTELVDPPTKYILRSLCPCGVCSLAETGVLRREGSGRVSKTALSSFDAVFLVTHTDCPGVWMVQMKVSLTPSGRRKARRLSLTATWSMPADLFLGRPAAEPHGTGEDAFPG